MRLSFGQIKKYFFMYIVPRAGRVSSMYGMLRLVCGQYSLYEMSIYVHMYINAYAN